MRTLPLIQYLSFKYSHYIILLYPISFKETSEYKLLIDVIHSYSIEIKNEYGVDESNNNQLSTVSTIVSSIRLSSINGGIILNYLETEEYHTRVYESLFVLLCGIMKCDSSSFYSSQYVIVSNSIELFNKVPTKYREGHLCRSHAYVNEDTANNIYNIGNDLYGKGVVLTESESMVLLSVELLHETYSSDLNLPILDIVESTSYDTSFGSIKIGEDHYARIPMYLLTSKDGEIEIIIDLYKEYNGFTFREQFNQIDSYKICQFKTSEREIIIEPQNILILIAINGPYRMYAILHELSYSVTIDYLNSIEKEKNIIYNPIIKSIDGVNVILEDEIKNMVRDYKTRIITGVYSYLF